VSATDGLKLLLDKQEIKEIIYKYCRAIDRRDLDLLQSLFHADSTHDHGPYEGSSSGFCRFVMEAFKTIGETQHLVGNILIDLEGDTAFTETYWVAFHRIPEKQPEGAVLFRSHGRDEDLFIGGRYIDRFECRDGVWKIAHRFGVHDWQRWEPTSQEGFLELPEMKRGRRDKRDRAYWRG
jgi:hypothetical protein